MTPQVDDFPDQKKTHPFVDQKCGFPVGSTTAKRNSFSMNYVWVRSPHCGPAECGRVKRVRKFPRVTGLEGKWTFQPRARTRCWLANRGVVWYRYLLGKLHWNGEKGKGLF